MKEIDSINELKHVIKTWKPDLRSCSVKCIYKILNTCSQQKNPQKTKKKHICIKKYIYV